MSKSEYQDLINEYKDQIRILKQEVAELQDAGKAKDSANKRTLQKLEYVTNHKRDFIHIEDLCEAIEVIMNSKFCLLYTSPSPRDRG